MQPRNSALNSPNISSFGMLMPERGSGATEYRYAYNGMELDIEPKGNGNSYTTEFRQYDPRLGRWLSLDPLMAKYPSMSPYVSFINNPIYFIDPYGLEGGPAKNKLILINTDGVDQYKPTPAGKTPQDWELENYKFNLNLNKWEVPNDWRLKKDEKFKQKMDQISSYGKKIINEGKKLGLNSNSQGRDKDINFSELHDGEVPTHGFQVNLFYKTKDGKRIPIRVLIYQLVYNGSEAEVFGEDRSLNKVDMSEIKEAGTNCYAQVLGLFVNIDCYEHFEEIVKDKGYKEVTGNYNIGDIWISSGKGHVMKVIDIVNGIPIFESTNRGYGTKRGTFEEINQEQFEGGLRVKPAKIFRKSN